MNDISNTQTFYLMEITNRSLMAAAKSSLKGNWKNAVIVTLVGLLLLGVSSIIPVLGALLLGGPIMLALISVYIKLARGQKGDLNDFVETLKAGLSGRFLQLFLLFVIYTILVAVGYFLLIVPGIILSLGLSQIFIIANDEPELDATEVLKKSWEMMKGYKMRLFLLYLRFIGWMLLAMLTFGIGYFWLAPYIYLTVVKFHYQVLKKDVR